jgi:hypothetical protein
MKAGDTFLAENNEYLWVVLSDPENDAERVLIVSITTHTPDKDQACLLPRGCHPWVTHDSCVAYDFAHAPKLSDLLALKDAGKLQFREPVTPALLKRMRDCVADSPRIQLKYADILIEQGLLDC